MKALYLCIGDTICAEGEEEAGQNSGLVGKKNKYVLFHVCICDPGGAVGQDERKRQCVGALRHTQVSQQDMEASPHTQGIVYRSPYPERAVSSHLENIEQGTAEKKCGYDNTSAGCDLQSAKNPSQDLTAGG